MKQSIQEKSTAYLFKQFRVVIREGHIKANRRSFVHSTATNHKPTISWSDSLISVNWNWIFLELKVSATVVLYHISTSQWKPIEKNREKSANWELTRRFESKESGIETPDEIERVDNGILNSDPPGVESGERGV